MSVACDACLRRSALITALAGHLEIAWKQRRSRLRDVLALPDDDLAGGLAGVSAAHVREQRPDLTPEALRISCEQTRATAICLHDDRYPVGLRDSADAPSTLFVSGRPERLALLTGADVAPAVAIVGTRRASPEATEVARGLGRGLAAAGVVVVSGMAMGIDAAAHGGALEVGGPTVAVLACGVDVAYPRREAALHRALRADELVVSELPPGCTPWRWAFPARNRIIALLGQATIVVEAAQRSGSLITAEFAAAYGRDVAVVPGRAGSPATRGGNELLREGAAVVLDAEDALDLVLGTGRPAQPRDEVFPADLGPELRAILTDIRRGHGSVAALVGVGHPPDRALIAMSELELRGLIRRAAGGVVVAIS